MDSKIRVAIVDPNSACYGVEKISQALDKDRYEVRTFGLVNGAKEIHEEAENVDAAIILPVFSDDGSCLAIKGLLDLLDIPYLGAEVLGEAIADNRQIAKILFENIGLPVPAWHLIKHDEVADLNGLINLLSFPMIVRPVSRSHSFPGTSVVASEQELIEGIDRAFQCDDEVIVEQYIAGKEIHVCVLGDNELVALAPIEIVTDDRYKKRLSLYAQDCIQEICPAEFDPGITDKVKQFGVAAHRALKLKGYSCTELIVSDENIFVIETDSVPNITPGGLFPMAAKAHGISYPVLIDQLLEQVLEGRGQ
jgi:D-alanine-D-alanine ligase